MAITSNAPPSYEAALRLDVFNCEEPGLAQQESSPSSRQVVINISSTVAVDGLSLKDKPVTIIDGKKAPEEVPGPEGKDNTNPVVEETLQNEQEAREDVERPAERGCKKVGRCFIEVFGCPTCERVGIWAFGAFVVGVMAVVGIFTYYEEREK